MGTGLVTSEGALWAKQRKLVSNAFRVEILDDIIGISLRAVERLVCCLLSMLQTLVLEAMAACTPVH